MSSTFTLKCSVTVSMYNIDTRPFKAYILNMIIKTCVYNWMNNKLLVTKDHIKG